MDLPTFWSPSGPSSVRLLFGYHIVNRKGVWRNLLKNQSLLAHDSGLIKLIQHSCVRKFMLVCHGGCVMLILTTTQCTHFSTSVQSTAQVYAQHQHLHPHLHLLKIKHITVSIAKQFLIVIGHPHPYFLL